MMNLLDVLSCQLYNIYHKSVLRKELRKLSLYFECCHVVIVSKFENNRNILDVYLVLVSMTIYASQFEEMVNEEQTV